MPESDTIEGIVGEADILALQAKSELAGLKDKDRSKIATLVILLYALVVVACFAFVIVGLWWFDACVAEQVAAAGAEGALPVDTATGASATATARACFAWKEPADYLLQVLTTAVLPIVTLVLGYYFGTAKAEGDAG